MVQVLSLLVSLDISNYEIKDRNKNKCLLYSYFNYK